MARPDAEFLLEKGLIAVQTLGKVALILVLVALARKVADGAVVRLLDRRQGTRLMDERRMRTLAPLLRNAFTYLIYFVGFVSILWAFGVETTSLIATAGLASLAIGFGAQNLVRDVITGFFILLEDQFAVGDKVTVAGVSGTVVEMGLRTTKLKGDSGQLHIIPNGQIGQVTNMGDSAKVSATVTFAKAVEVDRALAFMSQVASGAAGAREYSVKPAVVGVTRMSDASYDIEIRGETPLAEQERMEADLRLRLKRALEEEGL